VANIEQIVGMNRSYPSKTEDTFVQVVHPAEAPMVEVATWLGTEQGEPCDVENGLLKAIADRVATYDGPIQSTVGEMLWAIQAWYADVEDEESSEAILIAGAGTGVAPH
jgi:hypothetical protein